MCGDTPQQAGREDSRRPADYALTQRFCQLNPRGRLGTLLVDLDHQDGPEALDAPPATYATTNPQSGHCQAGYVLLLPVSRGRNARQDIQQLAADIHRALTRELRGDRAFAGLISRGPFHPDHRTQLVGGRIWTLVELLRDLPPMPSMTRREVQRAAEGADIEGRNCAAFEALRHIAYRLHDQGVSGASLLRQVQQQGDTLNAEILAEHAAGPLNTRELGGIVRSICKWVDANHRPARGSTRSRMHSRDRERLSEAQQAARMREGQAKGATTRREVTTARLRAAERQLIEAGELLTAPALAELAGVERKAALRYLRNAAQMAEIE